MTTTSVAIGCVLLTACATSESEIVADRVAAEAQLGAATCECVPDVVGPGFADTASCLAFIDDGANGYLRCLRRALRNNESDNAGRIACESSAVFARVDCLEVGGCDADTPCRLAFGDARDLCDDATSSLNRDVLDCQVHLE